MMMRLSRRQALLQLHCTLCSSNVTLPSSCHAPLLTFACTAGFKLDTLKKLATVKTADGKSSLLDFLARTAHEEGKVRGLARLPSDLAAVSAARNESLDALITDVKAIERGLQQAATQVELAAKSAAGAGGKVAGDKFEAVMRPFVDGAAVAVKRLVEDSGKLGSAFKDLVK